MSSEEMSDVVVVGAKVGSFVITRILGQGGFGLVAGAVDKQNNSIAIKFSEQYCEAMANEIEILTKLIDSGIVPEIYGSGSYKNYDFFTMEWMAGSLADILGMTDSKTFTTVVIQKIMYQGILALKGLHAFGLIHQDIKAGNLLLKSPKGPRNTTRLVIGDLGLCAPHAQGKRIPGSIIPSGRVPYASPAQQKGEQMTTWDDIIQFSYTPWTFQHMSMSRFLIFSPLEYKCGLLENPQTHLPQALQWMLCFYVSIQESLLETGVDYNILTEAVQDMLRDSDGSEDLCMIGGNEILA